MKNKVLKSSLLLFFILVVFFISCKKEIQVPIIPAGATPITITDIVSNSVSASQSSYAYYDQSITITGTGFNPDMKKDTVDFGQFYLNVDETDSVFSVSIWVFINNNIHLSATPHNTINDYVITSATSTQLVIKAVAPDVLSKLLFNEKAVTTDFTNSRLLRFRVRSNGASAISKPITIKNDPSGSVWGNTTYYTDQGGGVRNYYSYNGLVPGDTSIFYVNGIYSNDICEVKVELNCSGSCGNAYIAPFLGKNLSNTPPSSVCDCNSWTTVIGCNTASVYSKILSYDKSRYTARIIFVMPPGFFGAGTAFNPNKTNLDQQLTTNIKARVTNKDGRVSKVITTTPTFVFPFHI